LSSCRRSVGDDDFDELLADHPDSDDLLAAIVLAAERSACRQRCAPGRRSTSRRRPALRSAGAGRKTTPQKRIRRGAIVRLQRDGKNWQIVQLPEVESAFIAMDPQDGAVRALVGGFDFNRNKFNHVTQAWRQPGSSFKPFIYSASLEKGFTAATVIPTSQLSSRRKKPAASAGSRKTTTAASRARCGCAPRSPSQRTWSRSASSRRSGRSTRRTT
jgi:penicillin-binding protein 1A